MVVTPTNSELHLPEGDPITVVSYRAGFDTLRLVGTEDLPEDGQLENDARFAVFLGLDADPVSVLVRAEDTVAHTTASELISLINTALTVASLTDGRAVDLSSAIVAGREGNRLTFTTTGTGVSLSGLINGGQLGISSISGVGTVETDLAFSGENAGEISLDASFKLSLNSGPEYTILVTAAETVGFDAFELVDLLNAKLAALTGSDGVPARLDLFARFLVSDDSKLAIASRLDRFQLLDRSDVLRVIGSADVPANGILTSDANFSVIIGSSGQPANVVVPYSATRSNLTIDMLVDDINEAIETATFADGSVANLGLAIEAIRESNRIVLQTSGTLVELSAGAGDSTVTELQFSTATIGRGELATATAGPADGVISTDANFTVRLNGGRAYAFTLSASVTSANTTIEELVVQLNELLATATDSDGSSARLDQYVAFGSTADGRLTLTSLINSIQFLSQFGVYVDPDNGKFHDNDGGGLYELEDTGLNRVLGGDYDDNLYGGTGLDFLYGGAGADTLWRADGTSLEGSDGGLTDDSWKEYAQESDKVWYYAGSNADDVISVDYVTESGLLGGRHIITRLTDNNGNFTFDAQANLSFSATDSQGNPIYGDLPSGTLPPEDDYLAIIIDALRGNDTVNIGPTVQVSVWTDAGPGDDIVDTASGNAILADLTEQGGRNDNPATAYSVGAAWLMSGTAPDATNNYRLSDGSDGDPQFVFRLNGEDPVTVTVSGTDGNQTIGDLVDDLNAALSSAGLSARIVATLLGLSLIHI